MNRLNRNLSRCVKKRVQKENSTFKRPPQQQLPQQHYLRSAKTAESASSRATAARSRLVKVFLYPSQTAGFSHLSKAAADKLNIARGLSRSRLQSAGVTLFERRTQKDNSNIKAAPSAELPWKGRESTRKLN